MFSLRPLLRAALAWVLVTAALGAVFPQQSLAENGEAVSRTPHANTSELAISPDGSRVYLVWYDYQTAGGESGGGVYFRYRDAGGWHPSLDQGPVSLSDPNGKSQAPAIAVDSNGGIHVVWAEGSPRVIYHRMLPPGADPANAGAWSGTEVASNQNDPQTPSLAADNSGGIWMVYTVFSDPNYDIFARRRAPGGWEGTTNISRSNGRGAFLPRAGIDQGGAVSVVWWERPGVIRYVTNANGWGNPENATGPATQQVGIAVEPNGRVHLLYTESVGDSDNARRISYRTRQYWGAPWSDTQVLSETGNMLEPRIAWADGRLVATWSDRTGGEKQIFVMQNFGDGWRDRQAWTSGFNAFSPRVVEDRNRVAYVAFRNVNSDQIHVSIYTSGGGPAPSDPPAPPPSGNPALPATAILDGAHSFFPETGHNLGGAFRNHWLANGGLDRFGYPLTEEFTETSPDDGKEYLVQYFERARFEYHPENPAPYNVLLGRLGLRLRPLDPPADPLAGADYFPQTGHNLSGIFRGYWLANGGLAVFGYPTSEAFSEVSPTDGKEYLVQYFERNRFEYHPENAPPYNVQLGLLGRQELIDRGWLPR